MKKQIFVYALIPCWFFTLSRPVSAEPTAAQLALGGGFEVIVFLTNTFGGSTWTGTLQLRTGMDQTWPGTWSLNGEDQSGTRFIDMTILPDSTRKITLRGDEELRTGYFVLSSTSGFDLGLVTFFYNFRSDGILVDSIGVPLSEASARHIFAVEKTGGANTGLALAPDDERSAGLVVTLTLFNTDGAELQSVHFEFTGHVARFFDEIFENVPEGFVGSVEVRSVLPLHLTVLRLETTPNGFQLTATAPCSFGVRSRSQQCG